MMIVFTLLLFVFDYLGNKVITLQVVIPFIWLIIRSVDCTIYIYMYISFKEN
jgi:hypothetical protein